MTTRVLKFGGTSVSTPEAICQVYEIVISKVQDKGIIVLSAMRGITDLLERLSDFATCIDCPEKREIFEQIFRVHIQIIESLFDSNTENSEKAKARFIEQFERLKLIVEGVEILGELTPKVKDEILSFGEFFSSTIVFEYFSSKGLNCYLLDAREVIETDSNSQCAKPNYNKIEENGKKILELFKSYDIIVTQGFVGSCSGVTTTLGRGGSDFSAALFGYAIEAEEIQIWTDVDGILSADPKLVSRPVPLEVVSYDEIVELSFFGAKVLHPETLKPAMEKGIVVKVLNTFNPSFEGTTIVKNLSDYVISTEVHTPKIHSLVLIENCLLVKKRLNTRTNDFSYYFGYLTLPQMKLLHFNGNVNYFKAIVRITDTSFDFPSFFENEQIEYKPIDVIALCGWNLQKPNRKVFNQVVEILNLVKIFPIHQFVFRSSDYSIILAIMRNRGKELLESIHSVIVN